ncbi:MAG: helix-hairpin-helix domain-containing protein [Planctomycetia bacterium]|nr:helix-hairpin-helix domain-containing protein [Planctomycetia bacterium]
MDLNKATWSEITLLPGIGEKLAEKIVEERNRLGGFASPEELTNVHGIGKKKLEKIRPFIVVSQPRKEDHPVQVQIPMEKNRNL